MQEYTARQHALGTDIIITAITDISAAAFAEVADAVFLRIAEIEQRFSRFRGDSELSQLNQHAGRAVTVSPEFAILTNRALAFSKRTDGAFDPTVLAALTAAGYDRSFEYISNHATKKLATRARPNYRAVRQDTNKLCVDPAAGLDLGGIAKGYAVDEASKILAHHFQHYFLNAGGDIRLAGMNLEGKPWHIGIEDPDDGKEYIGMLAVSNASVATSGGYRRRWTSGGKAHHHIIDPRTGNPVENDISSVTVIAPTTELADSLATALYVVGVHDALKLAEAAGAEAAIHSTRHELFATSGMNRYLLT